MDADGGNPVNLTHNPAGDANPAWSPAGSGIAFDSFRDGDTEIYSMDSDGADQQRVTNSPGFDGNPDWSPDGGQIAFASERPGPDDIWVMNADGSDPYMITTGDSFDSHPAWSPDGTRIVYDRATGSIEAQLYVTNAESGGQAGLASHNADDFSAAWQALSTPPGDADCSASVNSVDALRDLRHVAGLPPDAACINAGNVDCDFDMDAVDSLFILRHVARLTVTLPQGCPEIGA